MYKDYTIQEVLDTLDVIDCYEFEGKKLRAGEILEEQILDMNGQKARMARTL